MTKNDDSLANYQSKYCYLDSEVLLNNYNVTDQETLDVIERRVSALMLTKIQMQEIPDARVLFSIDYICQLHKEIFEHIYSFAGKIRRENITKGNTPFCRPEFIVENLTNILKAMKKDIHKLNNRSDIIHFLAYYYAELNIIHPFREGNGRLMREYLRQIVVLLRENYDFNYDLDFSHVDERDKKNLINGSIVSAMTGELEYLEDFFDNTLKDKNKDLKR